MSKRSRMGRLAAWFGTVRRSLFIDTIAVAGFVALLRGLNLWFEPLAWIIGGILALTFALWARTPKSEDETE